jgi:uncharacterized protein (DUF1778 family)
MRQGQNQPPVTIRIRATPRQSNLIAQAAERLGWTRSYFILEAACREAEHVLLDQAFCTLNAVSFSKFQDLLDDPPAPTARLRRVLLMKAPWE